MGFARDLYASSDLNRSVLENTHLSQVVTLPSILLAVIMPKLATMSFLRREVKQFDHAVDRLVHAVRSFFEAKDLSATVAHIGLNPAIDPKSA